MENLEKEALSGLALEPHREEPFEAKGRLGVAGKAGPARECQPAAGSHGRGGATPEGACPPAPPAQTPPTQARPV